MKYKTLTIGDVRQKGDEQRMTEAPGDGQYYRCLPPPDQRHPGPWHPVPTLHGHAIIRADLCHLEFRRPV